MPTIPISQKQRWFRDTRFRQALSSALDRDAIVRLVYRGKAAALTVPVTPGNADWLNRSLPQGKRSLERSRELLRTAGFSWNDGGALLDSAKRTVQFSILTSAGNSQRNRIATLIQDDLKKIGIGVSVVSLEFRAMLDRIFQSHEYEAAIMTLDGGDTDPGSQMNVLVSKGNTRLWNLDGDAASDCEREIDDRCAGRWSRSMLSSANSISIVSRSSLPRIYPLFRS